MIDTSHNKVGVVSCNSLVDWIHDTIFAGIDIGYETALADYLACEGISEDDDDFDEKVQAFADDCEIDSANYLFGDWTKNDEGLYTPDPDGKKGFAAEFNSGAMGDLVWVNWSKTISQCRETSMCCQFYRPGVPQQNCGDLDSKEEGGFDTYDLPADYYRTED